MSSATRYRQVAEQVANACCAVGRDPNEVTLVAVSKTVGADAVAEVVSAGACNFGENRLDSLSIKQGAFPSVNWHFIGNIQSRKIPEIVACSSMIHSLYQTRHVSRISAAAEALGKVQDVLLEVNVSGEASKSGLAPHEVGPLLDLCLQSHHLRVCGLMTMAPQGDLVVARACFERLKMLRDELRLQTCVSADERFMHDLSMGMSEDWQEGIAAGATMVRVGRAIFNDVF